VGNLLDNSYLVPLLLEVNITLVLVGVVHPYLLQVALFRVNAARSYYGVVARVVVVHLEVGQPLESVGGPVD
jgi:hypothetical protein